MSIHLKYLFATLSVFSAAKNYSTVSVIFLHSTVYRVILVWYLSWSVLLSLSAFRTEVLLSGIFFSLNRLSSSAFLHEIICLSSFLHWVTVVVCFPSHNTMSGTAFCLCLYFCQLSYIRLLSVSAFRPLNHIVCKLSNYFCMSFAA